MADQPEEGGKRNAIVTYRELAVITSDVSEVKTAMAAMAVDVKNALALAASFSALELRVRTLEINGAATTASGAKSSQTWTTVFHGITTLVALFLASYPFFHH